MIIRVSKLVLRILALLLAVVLLAAGLFVWLLLTGPVSVAWLTPYLERELSSERAVVDIEATQLRLGEDQSLDLRAIGVRVRDPDGRLLSELPEVQIGLSTSAMLLEGRVAIRRIEAMAPSLSLVRRADGSIGIHRQPGRDPDAESIDLGGLLVRFLTASEHAERSDLEQIRLSGGELILEDQISGRTPRARDAELMIAVREHRVSAELTFRVDQQARPAFVHLAMTHEPEQEWIGIDLALKDLLVAEFADLAPDLPLSGIRLPLSGNMQGAVSLDGELAPILFDVAAQAGVVEVPRLGLGELPIEALWVQGTLAADLKEVVVDQLSVTSNGARLHGQGELAWRGGEPTLQANLTGENVTVADVARFWPPREGRRARAWVIDHIAGGVVPTARAQLRFAPGELGRKPLPEHSLSGEFVFEDLTVQFLDTMPPVVGVGGRASFTGQSMNFDVASGHLGDLVVDQGTVAITGIGIKGRDTTQLEIAADVSGPLQQALSLIDRPPLEFASRVGIAPETASGRVVTDLRIGMPLHRDFEPSEVRVAAEATITDGAATRGTIDVSAGQLKLSIDRQSVNLRGDAVVEGVPVTLQVRENLGEGGLDRRYQLEGSPDATLLREFGLDLPITLEGELRFSATVTEVPAMQTAEIALDLTSTAIEIPQLNWQKAPDEPGALNARARIPEGGPIQVTGFELTSDDLRAEGSLEAQIEPFRLAHLRLERVRFGDTRASITVAREDPAGYEVQIAAETLDLTRWLEDEEPERDEKAGAAESPAPLRLNLQAERVIVDGAVVTGVDADLARGTDGWRSADVRGRLPKGGEFALSLAPDGERQRLHLTSTDAGNLLRTLHQTSRIEGGQLELEAIVLRQQPSLQAQGELVVRQFDVLDAPILARLLTVASLTGIGNLLGGEGIAFDRLEVPFAVRNEVLQLERSRLYGSQLGLTFQGRVDLAADTLDLEGTIVPLYGINWTIGQIPIIGRLLRGSEGEGAFAATYSIRGPTDDATIRVNPLSALAPGFLRELFSGLREGTLEPPEMLPSHDD